MSKTNRLHWNTDIEKNIQNSKYIYFYCAICICNYECLVLGFVLCKKKIRIIFSIIII